MSQPPAYIAYLLRLWQVEIQTEPVWHASLEDPHTGGRQGFADLQSLFTFLEAQMANRVRADDPDCGVRPPAPPP
jgi:hypothetical protein